jgi:hypothetical protein
MTDTITVTINGRAVVFERMKTRGSAVIYANQSLRIEKLDGLFCAFCNSERSLWFDTPELAVDRLQRRANSWAPVLRELARIGGNDGKAE